MAGWFRLSTALAENPDSINRTEIQFQRDLTCLTAEGLRTHMYKPIHRYSPSINLEIH